MRALNLMMRALNSRNIYEILKRFSVGESWVYGVDGFERAGKEEDKEASMKL